MNYVGVDVSKDSFDAYNISSWVVVGFSNDEVEVQVTQKWTDSSGTCGHGGE